MTKSDGDGPCIEQHTEHGANSSYRFAAWTPGRLVTNHQWSIMARDSAVRPELGVRVKASIRRRTVGCGWDA